MITKYSTTQEIEEAAEVLSEFVKLKDQTIEVLKEKGLIMKQLLAVQEQTISIQKEQIKELKEQLDQTLILAQRASHLASRNI